MSKGLEYFKQVYDQVPGWVQKMHDYSPSVLDQYTGIRGEIMQDGPVLSRKEKDALIASMNASRLYARSMVYHTKGAIDFGFSVSELVEYFLVSYLSKGLEALKVSIEAVEYAMKLSGKDVELPTQKLDSVEVILNIYKTWLAEEDTAYLDEVIEVIQTGDNERIEAKILSAGNVSAEQKHLNIVGNFIVELKGEEAVPWIIKARSVGVKEEELADLGYICILTAGIPAWFELSDTLKQTDHES